MCVFCIYYRKRHLKTTITKKKNQQRKWYGTKHNRIKRKIKVFYNRCCLYVCLTQSTSQQVSMAHSLIVCPREKIRLLRPIVFAQSVCMWTCKFYYLLLPCPCSAKIHLPHRKKEGQNFYGEHQKVWSKTTTMTTTKMFMFRFSS